MKSITWGCIIDSVMVSRQPMITKTQEKQNSLRSPGGSHFKTITLSFMTLGDGSIEGCFQPLYVSSELCRCLDQFIWCSFTAGSLQEKCWMMQNTGITANGWFLTTTCAKLVVCNLSCLQYRWGGPIAAQQSERRSVNRHLLYPTDWYERRRFIKHAFKGKVA